MARRTFLGQQASNKEARILAAALRLFAERGLEATSMREVAAAVGITPATLYHYFPGKDELFAAVLRRARCDGGRVREILQGPGTLGERLERSGAEYLAAMRRPPQLSLILVRHSLGPADGETGARVKRLFAEHVEIRIEAIAAAIRAEAAIRRVRVDAERLASHFVHALTHFWVFESFVIGRAPRPDQARGYLAHLVRVCAGSLEGPATRRGRGARAPLPPGP